MATPSTLDTAADHKKQLQTAFNNAMEFNVDRATELRLTPAATAEMAEKEARFSRVSVDAANLSSGMKTYLQQPIREIMAEWRLARSEFDRWLQPKMKDIEAVARLESEASALMKARNAELESVERKLESNQSYVQTRDHKDQSEILWTQMRVAHSNRAPTMFAKYAIYWLLIVLIGAAEWLINYDTFLLFIGIPAIAAGATIILGFLLAFAAHGHGEILKQWSFRFSESRTPAERWTDRRMLALSTIALLIVLFAAGASRYQAALHATAGSGGFNILGAEAAIDVNPVRDVVISLLANVGAWLLGVFIAYISHDVDPDYMASTRQWHRARKRWNKSRKKYNSELAHIEAKFTKDIRDKEVAARTRFDAVAHEMGMLVQVAQRETALRSELNAVFAANVEHYRTALFRIVQEKPGQVHLIREADGSEMNPFELMHSKGLKDIFEQIAA